MSVRRTNRFWSVSLEHTLFLDFWKLFVKMRLAVSFAGKQKIHYLDLRIKSYGCLKFQGEVWAGRACAAANEEELTACAKICGQGGWARGAGGGQSGAPALGRSSTAGRGVRPRSAQRSPGTGDRRSAAGRPQVAACLYIFLNLFFEKKGEFFLKKIQALACSKGLNFLRGCVHSTPFFEVCPYTWKC
jgi:hypothetical protein